MSLTQNPKVGSRVVIQVNVAEVVYDYVNRLQTIKGLVVARRSATHFVTKIDGLDSQITLSGNRALYSVPGKIVAEIEDEYETYYKIEVKNQDRVMTFYMTPGDFVVTNEGE